MNQSDKAVQFKAMHTKGDPLVLYNIWDAGGAKALAKAGAKAVATGSWSVAAAHGYKDGERIPLDFCLQMIECMARSVDIPLSVDFEGAYAAEPEAITANVIKLIETGAIGINLEDRVVQGEGLYTVEVQVERIKAVRKAAEISDVPLFINARTDLFLESEKSEHESLLEDAQAREVAYANAGADGFFIPGLTELKSIRKIVDAASLPVNVMMRGDLSTVKDVADVGVSRASYGPGPYLDAMADMIGRFKNTR